MSKQTDTGTMFVGGLIAGSLIMAAGYGVSTDRTLWLRDTGLAEVAIGLFTLMAVVVGAWQANKSFKLSRSAAHSTRFADAARLLDGDDAAKHAGMALTFEIALENPETYGVAAIRSLLAVSRRETKEMIRYLVVSDDGRISTTYQGRMPTTEPIAIEAVQSACKLFSRISDYGLRGEFPEGKLPIQDAFVSGYSLFSAPYKNVAFNHSLFYETVFEKSSFENTSITACFAGGVTFLNCDVSGLRIWGSDRLGNDLQPNSIYAPRFINCTGIDTGTINELSISHYVAAMRR